MESANAWSVIGCGRLKRSKTSYAAQNVTLTYKKYDVRVTEDFQLLNDVPITAAYGMNDMHKLLDLLSTNKIL